VRFAEIMNDAALAARGGMTIPNSTTTATIADTDSSGSHVHIQVGVCLFISLFIIFVSN
jgi:hypothetical protein